MSETTVQQDTSGVRFPPPLYYLIGLIVGFVIQYFYAIHIGRPGHHVIEYALGGIWILAGLLLMGWALFTFRRAGTSPIPHVPTKVLTAAGPYRLTRNPMYLGMTLISVGASLAGNALWPLLSVPVALVLIDRLVIRKEEKYLERKFGQEYLGYKQRVRRWL